jgi:hypothetical protein
MTLMVNSPAAVVIPSTSPPAIHWTREDRLADVRIVLSNIVKAVRPEMREEVSAIAETLFEHALERTFGDKSRSSPDARCRTI